MNIKETLRELGFPILVITGLGVLIYCAFRNSEDVQAYRAYCASKGMTYLEISKVKIIGKTTTEEKEASLCLTDDGRVEIIPDGVQAQPR